MSTYIKTPAVRLETDGALKKHMGPWTKTTHLDIYDDETNNNKMHKAVLWLMEMLTMMIYIKLNFLSLKPYDKSGCNMNWPMVSHWLL